MPESWTLNAKISLAVKLLLVAIPIPTLIVSTFILIALLYPNAIIDSVCNASNMNRAFLSGIVFYNEFFWTARYPMMKEFSPKDVMLRSAILYNLASFSFAVIANNLYPNITSKSNTSNLGCVLVAVVIIEVIAKQAVVILDIPFAMYYALKDITEDLSRREVIRGVIKRTIRASLVNVGATLFVTIYFFATIIPVSLSHLKLSEEQKVSIYGILFPIFRFISSFLIRFGIDAFERHGLFAGNPEGIITLTFNCQLGICLYFGCSPLFCMLKGSTSAKEFILQYGPHAFFSKILWMIKIPSIEKRLESIKNKIFICKRNKKKVVVIQKEEERKETENQIPKASIAPEINSNTEKMSEEEVRHHKAGYNATISEQAVVLETFIVVIAYCFFLYAECFISASGSSPRGGDEWQLFIICVLGIIMAADQVACFIGFMLLLHNGVKLDANLGLNANNPLNVLNTFHNGKKSKAVGNLISLGATIPLVFLGIAIGEYLPLFIN